MEQPLPLSWERKVYKKQEIESSPASTLSLRIYRSIVSFVSQNLEISIQKTSLKRENDLKFKNLSEIKKTSLVCARVENSLNATQRTDVSQHWVGLTWVELGKWSLRSIVGSCMKLVVIPSLMTSLRFTRKRSTCLKCFISVRACVLTYLVWMESNNQNIPNKWISVSVQYRSSSSIRWRETDLVSVSVTNACQSCHVVIG